LLQYNTHPELTDSHAFSVDVLCVIVVMLSHIVYVASLLLRRISRRNTP
jgi:hypothetical protein